MTGVRRRPSASGGIGFGGRRLRWWAAVAVALVLAIGPAVAPAGASDADENLCFERAQGTMSVSTQSPVWGDNVTVTWDIKGSGPCSFVKLELMMWPLDPGGSGWGEALRIMLPTFSGSKTVTAALTGRWDLVWENRMGSKNVAWKDMTFQAFDPPPLTDPHAQVSIDSDTPPQRRSFVQAIRTPNAVVRIAGGVNLDLTGLENATVADGVKILGDRGQNAAGPLLFTHSFPLFSPYALLVLGNDVRVSGIRLQGAESDDPFSAVGKSDSVGIYLDGSQRVEIDQNDISHWRGMGIEVRDTAGNEQPSNGKINLQNADTVRIHDNYIHHNQHPSKSSCTDSGSSHAAGYGVELAYGAYATIERNVFDWNRHAIAGDGRPGTGYKAYDNLILSHGGVHFRCNPGGLLSGPLILNPFKIAVDMAGLSLDSDGIYHTHALDMHGMSSDCGFFSGDHNCGPAGELMDIEYNTIYYTAGNAIHLRGTPSIGMNVAHNVFAHGNKSGGAVVPGALLQNEQGLLDFDNVYGASLVAGLRGGCDFDGDGASDVFMASGVNWWYSASRMGGRWVFLNRSTNLASDLTLGDVTGDGRCDVTVPGGVIYDGGTRLMDNGSPIALATGYDGRLEVLGTNDADAIVHSWQGNPGDPASLAGWETWGGGLRSVAADTNADGRVEMFGVNGAGQVLNKWQWVAGAQWSDGWNLLGDGANSIAVTHNKAGYLEIFVTTPANTVKHRWQSPTGWSDWVPMEGGIHEITAHINGNGSIELVGVNTIGQIWHKRQTLASLNIWTPWQIMPGELASVALALNQDGTLEIFGANNQGQPFHSKETAVGSDAWQPWEQFSGAVSQVAAATTAGGKIELWGVNSAGLIYHRWQRTRGGDWSEWEQVGGQLRRTNR